MYYTLSRPRRAYVDRDAVRLHALLHHAHHRAADVLVRRRQLAHQDVHHVVDVPARARHVHQRNDVSHGAQIRLQRRAARRFHGRPQRIQHAVERLDAVRVRGLRQVGQRARRDDPHAQLLVVEPVLDAVHEMAQLRQHGAAHQLRDLRDDPHAGVARQPALLALADGAEEGEERRNAQRGGHDGEGARGDRADVAVGVVEVLAERGDHEGEARGLGEVADDFAALHAREFVVVDEHGLDHDEDLVHVGLHERVQLEEDAVQHFDEEMALLRFQLGTHQQGNDSRRDRETTRGPVEERACAEGHRALGDLPQRSLALERRSVLDSQQEDHDLAVARLLLGQRRFVHVVQQIGELLLVVRVDRHVLHHYPLSLSLLSLVPTRRDHSVHLARRRVLQIEPGRAHRRRRRHQVMIPLHLRLLPITPFLSLAPT